MDHCKRYIRRLQSVADGFCWEPVELLAHELRQCWLEKKKVFLCGNGGSSANAMHIANDFHYGCAADGIGIHAVALTANTALITCLANDLSYDEIFSNQLAVQGHAGDILIALSGSGNSPNILKCLEQAREMGVKSFAILGFSGGLAKDLADVAIHFRVDDMQIAEDMQLIVGHMLMQWLYAGQSRV